MTYVEIKPARAKKKDPSNLWEDPNWIAEEKWDGWRFLMHFGHTLDRMYLTGRRPGVASGTLSEKGGLVQELKPNLHIGYTVLDGEIIPPIGASFNDIAGIMNTSKEKAQARIKEIGLPGYRVIDILFYDGKDVRELPFGRRFIERAEIVSRINSNNIRNTPIIFDRKKEYYENLVADGKEGVILKHWDAFYGEGWIKVKRYSTLDVIITGFKPGKGKYTGQIGAALISVYDKLGSLIEIGRVSGMTDELRLDMTQNQNRWIGSVIEVHAQEIGKDRLRHPRFYRARPDADPRSATLGKMFQDLGVTKKPHQDQRQLTLL